VPLKSVWFSPQAEEVAAARRLARDVVTAMGANSDEIELAVSELATNAIRHAKSGFEVSLDSAENSVLVEVTDADPVMGTMKAHSTRSGRGLAIVNQLATSWGVLPAAAGGKTVWARFDVHS
jgi:anti-sigma regulatory factor (Ser/Thr protein kinase)